MKQEDVGHEACAYWYIEVDVPVKEHQKNRLSSGKSSSYRFRDVGPGWESKDEAEAFAKRIDKHRISPGHVHVVHDCSKEAAN